VRDIKAMGVADAQLDKERRELSMSPPTLSAWPLIALLLKKVGDEGNGPAKRVGLFSGEGRAGGCGADALRWAIGVNEWGAVPIHNATGVREHFGAPGRRETL
jgi:hypothetical protein